MYINLQITNWFRFSRTNFFLQTITLWRFTLMHSDKIQLTLDCDMKENLRSMLHTLKVHTYLKSILQQKRIFLKQKIRYRKGCVFRAKGNFKFQFTSLPNRIPKTSDLVLIVLARSSKGNNQNKGRHSCQVPLN